MQTQTMETANIGHQVNNLQQLLDGDITFQEYLELGAKELHLLGHTDTEIEAWIASQINMMCAEV